MLQYLICTVFVVLYILFMYLVGSSLCENEKSYPYKFIVGYLVFSFAVAIVGIPIQLLNLPWIVFAGYLMVLIITLVVFAIVRLRKRGSLSFSKDGIITFVRNQWVLVLFAFFLSILALSFINWLWMNNSMDDGFYLGKIASAPYNSTFGFLTSPSTGFGETLSDYFTYLLNTLELEYSVYCYFLGVSTTLFTRLFMAFFNYFLLACCLYVFAKNIWIKLTENKDESVFQWMTCIILFFGFSFQSLASNGILQIQDLWQFNSAMYYGSNVVRTCGIFLLLILFMNDAKITWKTVLYVIGICIVLVSKSTIAIPLCFIVAVSFLISHWFVFGDKKLRILGGLVLMGILGVGFGITIVDALYKPTIVIQETVYEHFLLNTSSLLFIGSLIIFAASFTLKNKYIYRLNLVFILMFALMFIDPLNNVFETLSMFGFVASRNFADFMYSFIALNFVYLFYFVSKYLLRFRLQKTALACVSIGLMIGCLFTSVVDNGDLISNYKIIYNNKMIAPQSTIELGKILESRYEERKVQNVVITPEGVMANNNTHSLSIILRTVSPHSYSISAVGRFGEDKNGKYKGLTTEVQSAYYAYLIEPNDETISKFYSFLETYEIDTIVVQSKTYDNSLQTMGFTYYDGIEDPKAGVNYYVYARDW
ncbi:hypothetical protein A4S06_08345 [Erysipelotrichaceae bacterium MTC7]|nr:hypothetical protein A4S06_08345 [Erysipelotrichaceae bacterium MTC7]